MKKNPVTKSKEIVASKNTPLDNNKLDETIIETNKKITKGLENPTASTGTPIDQLHGGEKFMAQLSNIGEGSVAIGGGGIKEGFNTISTNIAAKSAKTAILTSDKSKKPKIEKS